MKKLIVLFVLAIIFACKKESFVSENNNACVGGKHTTTPYELKTLTC
jgi:hypothetical protein